jgi:LPS sulfotransferase NodH
VRRGTTRNGVFGAKMMWNYIDDFRAIVDVARRGMRSA